MFRKSGWLLVLALVVAACGGGGGSDTSTTVDGDTTTTSNAETTTTSGTTSTDDDSGGSVGLNDIPQECIDSFVDFLQTVEPALDGVDFANLSFEELETLGEELEDLTSGYDDELADLGCDEDLDVDATDEETFAFLIDIARDEAPGTVAYLEWIRDFVGGAGEEASGDCDSDIAAIEAVIAEGGTMQSLPLGQITYVGNLIASIQLNCSAEQLAAFFARADVQAFMGSG